MEHNRPMGSVAPVRRLVFLKHFHSILFQNFYGALKTGMEAVRTIAMGSEMDFPRSRSAENFRNGSSGVGNGTAACGSYATVSCQSAGFPFPDVAVGLAMLTLKHPKLERFTT